MNTNNAKIPTIKITNMFGCYGREKDLLEIMGLLTPEEEKINSVIGYLTAEDVFERITKYLDRENKYLKDSLLKIINHYGVNGQQRQLMEEVFELQEAITLFENQKDKKEHITEEIADILVMIFQFIYFYDLNIDEITKMVKYKVKRQIKRIESEEKDENKNHRRYVRNSFIQKMDEEWGSDISHKYKQRCYNKKVRNKIKEMSQQEIKKYS